MATADRGEDNRPRASLPGLIAFGLKMNIGGANAYGPGQDIVDEPYDRRTACKILKSQVRVIERIGRKLIIDIDARAWDS